MTTIEDFDDDLEFDFEDEDFDDEYERPEQDYKAWVEDQADREWDDGEQARRDWEAEERGMRLRGEW
jgi:hypothetical protein